MGMRVMGMSMMRIMRGDDEVGKVCSSAYSMSKFYSQRSTRALGFRCVVEDLVLNSSIQPANMALDRTRIYRARTGDESIACASSPSIEATQKSFLFI